MKTLRSPRKLYDVHIASVALPAQIFHRSRCHSHLSICNFSVLAFLLGQGRCCSGEKEWASPGCCSRIWRSTPRCRQEPALVSFLERCYRELPSASLEQVPVDRHAPNAERAIRTLKELAQVQVCSLKKVGLTVAQGGFLTCFPT